MNITQLFQQFKNIKIAVVGDVMLDTYWWGNVSRISPEAPVPIVALHKKELRLGGAANVALNLVALQAQTTVLSVLGNDEDGNTLKSLLEKENINTQYLLQSEARITTNKIRIISRSQQMMRLDAEIVNDISTELENKLLQKIEQYIVTEKPAIIILQDYNKGVLTPNIIAKTIALCQQHNVLTAVDPKRKNFLAYKNVNIFKPNLSEVKDALNIAIDSVNINSLQQVHQLLHNKLQHQISFITLSEKGVFYNTENESNILPAHLRNIADVSGAGDTVISVAALVYACTHNMQLAANIANIAGGLVCEEVGTAAINKEKLLTECDKLMS